MIVRSDFQGQLKVKYVHKKDASYLLRIKNIRYFVYNLPFSYYTINRIHVNVCVCGSYQL